jgi:hypothetical protein
MLKNGITYLTFIYKLKTPIKLTYSPPKIPQSPTQYFQNFKQNLAASFLDAKLHLFKKTVDINDCETLTITLKELSNKVLRLAHVSIADDPVFAADIVSETEDKYFPDNPEGTEVTSMIYRGTGAGEIVHEELIGKAHSAFFMPVWFRPPIFGFCVLSGKTADDLLTDKIGVELFGTGAHICMSLYAKVRQDFRRIETRILKFFSRKAYTHLQSLTFISTASDELHTVTEKISILHAASVAQFFNGTGTYNSCLQDHLNGLHKRVDELLSFMQARHPLKESLIQIEQINSNRVFSYMFAALALVQILIALITVDWSNKGIESNAIYKNIHSASGLLIELFNDKTSDIDYEHPVNKRG